MNIALISSTKDTASTNIKERLLDNFDFKQLDEKFDNNGVFQHKTGNGKTGNDKKTLKNNRNNKNIKLYTINSMHILTDDLDKKIDADIFVVISRHRAEGGRASLTTHPIGNFGKAMAGGKDSTLCISPAFLLKNIFLELNHNVNGTEYEATLESTHHGPYMEKPVLYVELGSNEKFWEDKNGALIVAKSLMGALKNSERIFGVPKNSSNFSSTLESFNNKNPIINKLENNNENNSLIAGNNLENNEEKNNNNLKNNESVFVIGGSHYSHVANKVMLNTGYAVGHICPKHALENLNEEMLKQAMEKIIPRPKFVLLDWKGLGKEKQRILDLLKNNNLKFERSDKFFE